MGVHRFAYSIMPWARVLTVCVGITFCLGTMLLQGLAAGNTQTDEAQSIDVVLAQADAYSQQVHSGRFLFRTEAEFLNDEEQNFVNETEIWFDGVRCRAEYRTHFPNREGVVSEGLTVFDGEKVTRTGLRNFEFARVAHVTDLTELPRWVHAVTNPVWFAIGPAYAHSLPLGGLIRAWGGRLVDVEEVNGEACYHLTADPRPGTVWQITRSWWLSPSKGYAVVRYVEEIVWETGQTASKRTEDAVEEWSVMGSNIWIPRIVTQRVYIRKRGGVENLGATQTTTMLAGAPNVDVSDDVFRLELPDTTRVIREP